MTTTYTLTKRSGEVLTFTTALTTDQAGEIVSDRCPLTEFTGSLLRAWRRGSLSEPQRLWLLKLAHDATVPAAPGPYQSLADTVNSMQAKAKGRVALRLDGLTVKAVTRGPNEGSLYLYQGEAYAGKITATGQLHASDSNAVAPILTAANADPVAAAREYGYRTGSCSCCGRTLTDPVSIFGGIGPICLERLAGPEARKALQAEFKLAKA
jgi:hypothetical protein